jgi:protein-S-isoprenylcysteine O-methyltransferase Ste14
MRLVPFPWTLTGLLPLGVGLWICVWADALFRRKGTTVKPSEEPSTLVAGGPFAVSRNPMYLGMLLALAGVALLLGSATPFVPVLAFYAVMRLVFIPSEERAMREAFGVDWSAYASRVRRWI